MRATSLILSLPILLFAAHASAQDLDDLLSTVSNSPPDAQPAQEAQAAPGQTQPAQNTDEPLPIIPVPQQKEEPAPEVQEPPPHAQIEEIIVTATKREESVREIPSSISVMSGKQLEEMGAHNLQ
ncbi:MAG: hypothetical protein ACRETM_02710, partial [Stenotrophobium sp.]